MKTLTFSPWKTFASSRWLLLVLVASAATARAVDGTWLSGQGSSVWSTSSNWTGNPSPVPGGAGSIINLNTGTGGSVFVIIDGAVASRTAGVVNFGGSSPWTIDSTGGGTLTLDNSGSDAQVNIEAGAAGSATISAPVILASSVVLNPVSANRTLSVNAVISETGGARSVTKNGQGSLLIPTTGNNTYSGGFTLNAGSVRAENNAGFGTGTLTLNGGTVDNTGGSRFYANTLNIGGNITLGSSAGGSNTFSGNTTLTTHIVVTTDVGSPTLAGVIGDGGNGYSLTKNGTGNLGLSSNNTYSGGFVLNAGTVTLSGGNGANGVFGSGNLTVNGGTISGGGAFTRVVSNAVTYNGDATIATGSRVDYSGAATLTGNRVLTNDVNSVYSGTIGDGGGGYSLTKAGAGTLFLGNTTYTGGTIVNAGTVSIGGNSTLASSGAITVNGGTLSLGSFTNSVGAVSINGGTLNNTTNTGILSSSSGFTATAGNINAILAGTGSFTKNGAGTATFGAATGGTNTYSGGTVVNAGTLALGVSNRLADTGTLSVNGGAFDLATFSDAVGAVTLAGGSITSSTGALTASSYALQSGSASAILAGSAAASKTTSGTATLSGINTYTGATTISAGTLIVSGSGSINTTSGIAVSAGSLKYDSSAGLNRNVSLTGGALAYNSSTAYSGSLTFTSGTVGGTNLNGNLNNLTIGANQTISPGNSPGTAATGSQTWAGGGSYIWEINNATGTAGTDPGWDLLTGTGSLSVTATAGDKFNINVTSLTLANVAGNAVNFDNTQSYNWMLADFSSAITLDASVFNINVAGFLNSVAAGSSFGLALGSNPGIGGDNTQLYLTYTAIPEPSTWLLFGLGLTVTLFLRRRRLN